MRDLWVGTLQCQIAPHLLLSNRFRKELIDSPITERDLQTMHDCFGTAEYFPIKSKSVDGAEGTTKSTGVGAFLDKVAVISNFVQTIAVLFQTSARASAPGIKETKEFAGSIAKCITVVGYAFQVVNLCITIAEMASEAKQGLKALPKIRARADALRSKFVECMLAILHPDGQVDEILVQNMFKVQEQVWGTLDNIESHIMCHRFSRFLKAASLDHAEQELESLEQNVISMMNTSKIVENTRAIAENTCALSKIQKDLESLQHTDVSFELSDPRYRPRLNPYFVGRREEICTLKAKLMEYGSMVISKFGGVGKTQLLIAFAEAAEKEGLIPGGCFWVPAHGSRADVMNSLANFVESLNQRKLQLEHRNDALYVLGELQKQLASVNGRWLICLDNADEPEINGIIGDLCRITELPQRVVMGFGNVSTGFGATVGWNGTRAVI